MPRKRSRSLRLHRPTEDEPVGPQRHPRSWHCDATGAVHRDIDPKRFRHILDAGVGTLWLDLDDHDPSLPALLRETFRLHPLSIEDTQSSEGRVKVEEFPHYVLIVVRGVRFITETEELYDIETFNLWCFVGKNFVVTVHGPHAPGVEATKDRVQRADDLLGHGAARLAHHILDATVDAYFPIVDQLDEFVDGLEERVFVEFDQGALHDIFSVKRLVLQLRRHLSPMREVFNVLQSRPSALVGPDTQVYFRDVYDHVIRLNESLDTYRDLLTSTLDAYLTQISNRMGQVTKGLTVVATLSVPFVVVSGMWGMNFVRVPLAEWPNGFWLMLALQLGLGAGLVWFLRRNRML